MSDFMALLVATVPFFEFLCAFISFCDKLHKAPLYDKSNQTVQSVNKLSQLQTVSSRRTSYYLFSPPCFISSEAVGKRGVGKNLILF